MREETYLKTLDRRLEQARRLLADTTDSVTKERILTLIDDLKRQLDRKR
jgi:hypothetical protein